MKSVIFLTYHDSVIYELLGARKGPIQEMERQNLLRKSNCIKHDSSKEDNNNALIVKKQQLVLLSPLSFWVLVVLLSKAGSPAAQPSDGSGEGL